MTAKIENAVIAGSTAYYVDTTVSTDFDPFAHKMAFEIVSGWGLDGYLLYPNWEQTEQSGLATPVRLFSSDLAVMHDFVRNYTQL